MIVLAHRRAADDFEAIRARLDELRRERAEVVRGEPIGSPQPSSPRATPGSPARQASLQCQPARQLRKPRRLGANRLPEPVDILREPPVNVWFGIEDSYL